MASGQLTQVLIQLRRMLGGPAGHATDRQLLEQYAAVGDEAAFSELVRRHGPLVQGVCRRILGRAPEADDAFQATFLVLARKAGSVFWQDSVANWLYGVAYRTASKVRAQSARRRRHEQEAAGGRGTAYTENPAAHELHQVLDEELVRLPEKFRLPVLLCCLQDQTIDEAAQQLGWSFATVKGRLQRGRDLLRERLERRGLGLSAGVLASVLTEGVVRSAPPLLLQTTVQTVVGGTIPSAVATLAQGVMQAMLWTKLKMAALVLLALAVLGGGGVGTAFLQRNGLTVAAPLPDEVKRDQPLQPNSLVEQDGLEVVVKLSQARYGANETPAVEITYTNRTDKPFRLYGVGYEVLHFSLLEVANNGPWQAGPWAYDEREAAKTIELPAGQSHVQSHAVRGLYTWKGRQREPVPPRNTLRAGKYRLTAVIRFRETKRDPVTPYWKGEVATKPIEFEVADAADVKASEPVEKDGLSLSVRPAKAVFAADEALVFDVIYQNVSDKTFKLSSWSAHQPNYTVNSLDQQQRWFVRHRTNIGRGETVTLAAGESTTIRAVLDETNLTWNVFSKPPARPIPGHYRFQVEIGQLADQRLGVWGGKLLSKPVDFTIATETSPATAVKDSLSLAVKPGKAAFAIGDPLTFDLLFKNVGENSFWLHGLGWPRDWDVRILEAGWEGYWKPIYQEAAERPNPAADIANLKPQGERAVCLALGGVKYEWQGPQNRPRGPLDRLPAGKYQLEVRMTFGQAPPGALPGGNRDPYWVGAFVSKPAAFEIADAASAVHDANTGITVTITDNAQSLTAKNTDGKEIWKLNLLTAVGEFQGQRVIGSVEINKDGLLEARFGKSNLARIDLKTGKLLEHLAR